MQIAKKTDLVGFYGTFGSLQNRHACFFLAYLASHTKPNDYPVINFNIKSLL